MQRTSFEVVFDPSRTDSFVTVSAKFIDSSLTSYYGGNVPPVVPLQLSDGKKKVYVGCLTGRPHNLQTFKLFIPIVLGEDMGLKGGEIVQCVPVYNPAKAVRVLVSPASVDDSEVVEQNALRIEGQLLRHVQVVFPGMTISVVVFDGAHAKVVVQRIEDAHDHELKTGCAVMMEGTEFVIATKKRQVSQSGEAPMWTMLRCHARARHEQTAVTKTANAELSLLVSPVTAELYHWKEGQIVGFFDLARTSQLLEGKQITPSFLRSNAWKAPIQLIDGIPDGVCSCAIFEKASNLVVFPNPDDNVPNVTEKDLGAALCGSSSLFQAKSLLCYEEVVAVHGVAASELLRHLKTWFTNMREPISCNSLEGKNGNVLLCGGNGYGKTTVVDAVLGELDDVHACAVQCTSDKKFLSSLQEALAECVMSAPSVLILDNFDVVAPLQKEGSVTAISEATKSILEDTLRYFNNVLTLNGQSSVVIVATCGNREDVHESLRSASCFAKVIKLEALNRKTRFTLVKQLFPNETIDDVEKLSAMMDNFTPFDIKKISVRIKASLRDGKLSSVDAAKDAIVSFTPLSHTGINFLKGEKESLDSIGGLSAAKKVLFDTLVLPMKHPELFARLPLKTRSGVLLYGHPGCGKTFVVEAVVNSEGLNCIVVNGPEVFGKYIGQSEQKIRDVFERAQAAAPCVVFFDEFDSVAPQRGVDNSGVTDRVVNQLLCYLDGVEGRKDVYVVAASSRPDLIDAALLRPGRLDKAVQCPIPSYEERLEILINCFKKVSAELTQEEMEDIARQTVNWTPADLSGLVSLANLHVSRRVIAKLSHGGNEVENAESEFTVANVGGGTTREKVEDALKPLLSIKKQKQVLDVVAHIVMEDVKNAMAVTRPSLTSKDILKYERIHRIFSGEKAGDNAMEVGKKLALQ